MDFAPIPPLPDLKKYLNSRDTWFALAHVTLDEYMHFYHHHEGKTLILDNGSYEGAMNLDIYSSMIEYYRPTVAVLPDILLGDAKRSMHLSLGFLEACGLSSREYRNEWMFVPQAPPGDLDGFISSLYHALQDKRITWIGLPRCLVTDIADNPMARINLASALKKDYPEIKIHALGMINGCVPELYYLQAAGVRSCDSSWPFNNPHYAPDDLLERIDQCLTTP